MDAEVMSQIVEFGIFVAPLMQFGEDHAATPAEIAGMEQVLEHCAVAAKVPLVQRPGEVQE